MLAIVYQFADRRFGGTIDDQELLYHKACIASFGITSKLVISYQLAVNRAGGTINSLLSHTNRPIKS